MCTTEVASREELREPIEQECNELRNTPRMIRNSINNLKLRARKCIEIGGGNLENVVVIFLWLLLCFRYVISFCFVF